MSVPGLSSITTADAEHNNKDQKKNPAQNHSSDHSTSDTNSTPLPLIYACVAIMTTRRK